MEFEAFRPFIPHQHLGLNASLAQVHTVNQSKWMTPFLTQFLWDLVGAQSQVNLYVGRGVGGLPKEFPFRDTGKAVLRKLGNAGVIVLAKHLLEALALADCASGGWKQEDDLPGIRAEPHPLRLCSHLTLRSR